MPTLQHAGMRLGVVAICLLLVLAPVSAGTFTANNDVENQLNKYEVRAAQFLGTATFGPTPADIDNLARRMQSIGVNPAKAEWIDQQFALPLSSHFSLAQQLIRESGLGTNDPRTNAARMQAWWHNAIAAPDQLRQRVAWALAQIWVIAGSPYGQALGTAHYYDVLAQNSFGNYRDLMGDVTLHPMMGIYLSYFHNQKPNPTLNRFPDENYARELLQLFTIGPLLLYRDGTWIKSANGEPTPAYSNKEIEAFARVFTGFSSGTAKYFWGGTLDPFTPMKMFESEHDRGRKELLSGRVLPAGQPGMRDVKDALDNIFEHPNVGPFVSRLLIQRLVKSNPSRSYVNRVAMAFNGDSGSARGDMRQVIKAILLDPEASSGTFITQPSALTINVGSGYTHNSRLQEPVVRFASLIRAFNPSSDCPSGRFIFPDLNWALAQNAYDSPSVFNFYLADFRPGGALQTYTSSWIRDGILVAPEFQLLSSSAVNRLANIVASTVRSEAFTVSTLAGRACKVRLDFLPERNLAASNPTELMRHLDLLLCQGTMSDGARGVIQDEIVRGTNLSWLSTTDRTKNRFMSAVIATTLAPECVISP